MATMTYAARAKRYAENVVSGKQDACLYVRSACQRHLDDLAKYKSGGDYRFDAEKANKRCKAVENFKHIKGKWANEYIKLEDWQCFIICCVFGWLNRKTGFRKYRTVYIEVPRKNAKSTLTSAIGLTTMVTQIDGEAGAEVYSAATTRDQARIVFRDAQAMARKSPEFRKKFGIQVHAHSITQLEESCKFEALSAEGSTLDGLNTHFAAIDELHAHKTRAVFDVIETSTGSRVQSILWIITTAGSDQTSICYEQRDYAIKILEKVFDDETYFALIYTVDKEDLKEENRHKLFTDEALWRKANPNYGVSVLTDDFKRLAAKAAKTPSAQNNFLTKRLDVWVNAASAWLNILDLDRCADPSLDIEDFAGEDVICSLDLATKTDVAVDMKLFRRVIDERYHYYAFGRYYLPRAAIMSSKNSQYEGWADQELFEITEGNIIDYDTIEENLLEDKSRFTIRECAYDPFQATKFATDMTKEGFLMVEIGATVKNFSEPMKELEAVILDGRFHYDGNPILKWMFSNVVCTYDKKDNTFPNKERPENKIDGVVALIMAMNRWLADEGPVVSVYQKRGLASV